MADPFANGLDALFHAPGSATAVYQEEGDWPVQLRVIWSRPDQVVSFRNAGMVQGANSLQIRAADVARPVPDATVTIGSVTLRLVGEPMLDVEGLSWTCGADPA